MITFIIGTVVAFICGLILGRRRLKTVEAALLDAQMIANDIAREAELTTKKLKEELEQVKVKKSPKKKKGA